METYKSYICEYYALNKPLSEPVLNEMLGTLSYLNDIILCTFGASGISVNREVAKNDMRLRASKFAGMSIAVSLTVINK